jgi:hypothetical protein
MARNKIKTNDVDAMGTPHIIELGVPFAKPQHWRALWKIFSLSSAPVLAFNLDCIRLGALEPFKNKTAKIRIFAAATT